MKKILLATWLTCSAIICLNAQPTTTRECDPDVRINAGYSRAAAIRSVMDKYTAKGLPGLSVAVYSETEGWWSAASGYSRLETKTPMTVCNLQYLQSVAKTFMAVAILQLQEQGKLKLDEAMTNYLPEKYSKCIRNAGKISIRMLLNHTSGITEYISHPKYTETVILQPTKVIKIQDVLFFLENEEPQFAPGAEYRYTNTNYLLLAMIVDAITGDHARFIARHIFQPLGMLHTFNKHEKNFLANHELPDSYWDILSTGRPANITAMQKANVAPLIGDDGIISTPVDAVKFLKGLMEGKLLNDSSMKEMQQWVKNDAGKPVYGLGLTRYEEGAIIGYGHGGGGLGAGCLLLYVPGSKVYVFLATNTGVVIDGLGGKTANEMKDEILAALLTTK